MRKTYVTVWTVHLNRETVALLSWQADRGLQSAHRIISEHAIANQQQQQPAAAVGVQGRALPVRTWHAPMQLLRPVLFASLCTPCDNRHCLDHFLCAAYASSLDTILIDTWWPSLVNTSPPFSPRALPHIGPSPSAMSDVHDINIFHSCTLNRHIFLVLAAASLVKATYLLLACLLGRPT